MTNAATPINAQVAAAVAQQRANLLDPADLGHAMTVAYVPSMGIDRLLWATVARGFLTVVAGHGGSSKSTFVSALCWVMVTGRGLVGAKPAKTCGVLYLGLEDDFQMVGRMFKAQAKRHALADKDQREKLVVYGKDTLMRQVMLKELSMLKLDPATRESVVDAEALLKLEAVIAKAGCPVVILDPLAVLYAGVAITNEAQNLISRTLSDMASRLDIGLVLVAHTRKPSGSGREQTQHDTKHGSELVDTARVVVTVQGLTATQYQAWSKFVAVDELTQVRFAKTTKSNIGRTGDTVFYRVDGEDIRCGDGKIENVGVVEAWQPPAAVPPDTALLGLIRPILEDEFIYASPNVRRTTGKRLIDVLNEVCEGVYDPKAAQKRFTEEGWIIEVQEAGPAGGNRHKVGRASIGQKGYDALEAPEVLQEQAALRERLVAVLDELEP